MDEFTLSWIISKKAVNMSFGIIYQFTIFLPQSSCFQIKYEYFECMTNFRIHIFLSDFPSRHKFSLNMKFSLSYLSVFRMRFSDVFMGYNVGTVRIREQETFVFRKIWRALFSRNTGFKIRPFALLSTIKRL